MVASTAVARIEHQRPLVVPHGGPKLREPSMRVANVVLNIRIQRIARHRQIERGNRDIPAFGGERSLAGCEIGIELRPIGFSSWFRHGGAERPRFRYGGCYDRSGGATCDRACPCRAARGVPRASRNQCAEQCGRHHETHHRLTAYLLARNVLASRVSALSPSPFRASSATLP